MNLPIAALHCLVQSPQAPRACITVSSFCKVIRLSHLMQGTVLIKNAEELQSYSQGEEDRMEQVIKGIADS